jgi:hypothetical protein
MKEISETHLVDIKRLVEENINSYQAKLESITRFMEEAADLVQRISEEQDQLAMKLRDMLAKSQCLRKKDFDYMFCPVKEKRKAGFERVSGAIEEFRQGEYKMIAELYGFVAPGSNMKLADFYFVREGMFEEHDKREADVIRAIRNFHLQQEELLAGLKGLVAKGDGVRIADFKVMIRDLDARVLERESEMGELLEEIRDAAHVIRDDWEAILSVRGQEI